MSYWDNLQERLHELSKLRAKGYTWLEIKELTGYEGTAKSLRTRYSHEDIDAEYGSNLKVIQQRNRAQKTAREERKLTKDVIEALNKQEDLLDLIKKELSNTKIKVNTTRLLPSSSGEPMTCEILVSDIQIGKVTPDFNTEIAFKRMEHHGKAALMKLNQHIKNGYKPERIILSLMGDIIESAEKATKKGTPHSVDSTTTEQIVNSIKGIFQHLIAPIAATGIPVEVIGVPGNHDHRENGMPMDSAGRMCDTWIIYKCLEMLSESFSNVTFNITEGVYATTEIYGHTVVYEHGYGLPVSESALLNRLNQRSRQEKKYITYFRMGDKHNISRFNEDQLVVNGAYFGESEGDQGHDYSSAMGYSAKAGQVVFFHIPRVDDNRLPCYDSFIVQLCHIK